MCWLKSINSFLTVLETGKFKFKAPADSISDEGLFLGVHTHTHTQYNQMHRHDINNISHSLQTYPIKKRRCQPIVFWSISFLMTMQIHGPESHYVCMWYFVGSYFLVEFIWKSDIKRKEKIRMVGWGLGDRRQGEREREMVRKRKISPLVYSPNTHHSWGSWSRIPPGSPR